MILASPVKLLSPCTAVGGIPIEKEARQVDSESRADEVLPENPSVLLYLHKNLGTYVYFVIMQNAITPLTLLIPIKTTECDLVQWEAKLWALQACQRYQRRKTQCLSTENEQTIFQTLFLGVLEVDCRQGSKWRPVTPNIDTPLLGL